MASMAEHSFFLPCAVYRQDHGIKHYSYNLGIMCTTFEGDNKYAKIQFVEWKPLISTPIDFNKIKYQLDLQNIQNLKCNVFSKYSYILLCFVNNKIF